ncbi:MAG: hypothetical protein FJX77_03940, partial [Armatimonadetes bacterium]|nr:hypothetical protein [Armatimonadota bacterium]
MNCSEPDSLPIHRLAVYNPRRLSDSEVAAGFVARLPLLELLLRDLDGTPADAIPQHHLLVGQRGTGKTTLLRRLEAALREPPRAERFLPLSFPEEQYGVDRLSRFWLNCLDSLAEALEAAGRSEAVRVVDAAVGRLPAQFPGESRLAEEAAQVLLELGRRHGRRLVLLVDNLDLVLERLTAAEQHCLRAVLMRPAAPVVLGASVNPPRATTDYGAPFYDHFQTHFLNRLSLVEMQEVLRRLAQQTGRPEILSRLEAEHPRLQALYDLTGGNPRTTVLLFQLFAQGFSPEAYQDLEALLDWVTPLYKARFEELSDQAQVLVSALALAWSPVTSRRLGELTRLTNGQVSPELTRLQRAGFLEAVTVDPDERVGPIPDVGSPQDRTGYQLGERFFNIWFLMRHATRRDRRNLVFLTRFLESLYTAGERSTYARKLLSQRSLSRRERILGLALEPALEETALRHELRDHVHQEFLEAYRHLQERIDEILDPAEIPPHRYAFSELRDRLLAACPAGLEETPEEFADALLSSPALLLHREGLVTLQRNADQANALLEFAREDLALLPRRFDVDSVCWFTTLLRRGTLTSFDEPVQMSEIALRVETPGQARICTSFAGADALCGLTDPAFQSLSQHLAPAESSPAGLWYGWGFELDSRYRRYPAAEMAYREAIARAPQEFRPWNNLGVLLMNDSRRDAEAEQALREAIARAPQEWRPWNNLGILLTTHRRRYTEAEQAFCEAIARAPQASRPWINLGILLQEHLGRYA